MRQVGNSTGQRTPAIYQSNHGINASHASHLPIISPRWAKSPRIHSTWCTRTRTHKNAQHTAARATMNVRSRHVTNPRSTHYVVGKASECRRRPRSYHIDPLSRRGEVAHGVLCFSPKPEQTFFSPWSSSERRGIDIFCRLFSTHQPTTHLRSRYRIKPRSTRFVSGKASEYRWRPNFMWIHGLGGERLLVMPYAPCPNPKNASFFAIKDGSRFFLSFVSYTPVVKRFFLRRLAGARHISPAFV